MKAAILGSSEVQKKMQAKLVASDIQLVFADSVDNLLLETSADIYFDFGFQMSRERINMLSSLLPRPVFVNSVINTLDEIGFPFIRINAWPTFFEREIWEIAVNAKPAAESAINFFEKLNLNFQITPDITGMISARIIAMIINEAYYTLQENVSSKDEIDIAMKLGTNYPFGPFEWSRKIGLKNIYELLLALEKNDHRYIIAALLAQEAGMNNRLFN